VVNGDITLVIQSGHSVNVLWTDTQGNALGPAVPLATMNDLNNLRQDLSSIIGAANLSLSQRIDALSASTSAAMSTTASNAAASLSSATSGLQSQITSAASSLSALSTGLSGLSIQLTTGLENVYNNLSLTQATTASATSALISNTSSTLTNLIASSVSTASTSLQATINTKVDVGNLTVIRSYVTSVVLSMVAVNASNDLSLQLASKLTNSPTCSCFDPRTLTAMQNTISALVNATNMTLSCSNQGLVYNAATMSCVWMAGLPDCGSRITSLSPYATASCGLTPGSTKVGATCIASCNQGYSSGTNALFTCNASSIWGGSLSCPGLFLLDFYFISW
jgi:hypothetical protein